MAATEAARDVGREPVAGFPESPAPSARVPRILTSVNVSPVETGGPSGAADRGRLAELVERHTPFVRRYLRVLGAADDLEDLQQETFVALCSGTFVEHGDVATRAFLRRTARNVFLRRHRGRLPQVAAADEVWDRRCGHDADGSRAVELLRECLQRLGDRARALVDATYRDGRSRDETARAFGMSPDGVKSALRRIRRALAQCIERRSQP